MPTLLQEPEHFNEIAACCPIAGGMSEAPGPERTPMLITVIHWDDASLTYAGANASVCAYVLPTEHVSHEEAWSRSPQCQRVQL